MKFFYDFFTKNSRDVGGFWWLNISLEFWNLPSDWALPKRMFYKFCILRISPLQARIRGGELSSGATFVITHQHTIIGRLCTFLIQKSLVVFIILFINITLTIQQRRHYN